MSDTLQEKCTGQMAMAWLVVIGAFSALGCILFHPIPAENRDLVNIVIGMVIGTGFGSIISYYYGSSSDSRAKDSTISSTMKTLAPTDVPPSPVNDTPVVNPAPVPPPAPPVPDAPKPA